MKLLKDSNSNMLEDSIGLVARNKGTQALLAKGFSFHKDKIYYQQKADSEFIKAANEEKQKRKFRPQKVKVSKKVNVQALTVTTGIDYTLTLFLLDRFNRLSEREERLVATNNINAARIAGERVKIFMEQYELEAGQWRASKRATADTRKKVVGFRLLNMETGENEKVNVSF